MRGASGPVIGLAVFTATAVVLTTLGVLFLSGGEDETKPGDSSDLEAAFTSCSESIGSSDTISVDDLMSLGANGDSITVSNESEASGDFAGALTANVVSCLIGETGAPDSLGSEIEQTTAIMGRQSESWDNLTFEWSYHPDRGISAVLKQSN